MTRATWDETWMAVADVVAHRSLCVRAQVGAVVVDSTNRIVATGFNGPPSGFIHRDRPCSDWCARGSGAVAPTSNYDDCPSLHAEANAIAFCDRRDRLSGTIYVTGPVCVTCAKMLANSGLSRVVYRADTVSAPYRDALRGNALMRHSGLAVQSWTA